MIDKIGGLKEEEKKNMRAFNIFCLFPFPVFLGRWINNTKVSPVINQG